MLRPCIKIFPEKSIFSKSPVRGSYIQPVFSRHMALYVDGDDNCNLIDALIIEDFSNKLLAHATNENQ